MVGEKFRDLAVDEVMHEYQQGDNVGQMLDESDTNTRYNEALARVQSLMEWQQSCWHGKWSQFWSVWLVSLRRKFLNIDGYARVQAIEMCQARTMTDQALFKQQSEKKGLLGGLLK